MSTHSRSHTSNSNRDSLPSESGRIALVDRTRRPRRRAPNVQTREQHSFREYIPSGIKLFDDLHTIEIALAKIEGAMSRFVSTNMLVCRVYYTFLFHIRFLQARIDAGVAHPFEVETIDYIDKQVHIGSLPVHDELVEAFRLSFPAVPLNRHTNGLCPTQPEYVVFDFDDVQTHKLVNLTWISPQFSRQPSIRVGFHFLRWLNWNKNPYDNEDLPSVPDRLKFLVHGLEIPSSVTDSVNERTYLETMHYLFSNPMFKRHLPNVPGPTYQSLHELDEVCIPPAIDPISKRSSPRDVIQNELQFGKDLTWLNHCKYIVSTLCHLTGYVAHFGEVNQPYSTDEIRTAIEHINLVEQTYQNELYHDARAWMTIFNDNSDFFTHSTGLARMQNTH